MIPNGTGPIIISCRCLNNVLEAEPISLLWVPTDSMGAFYWTKFRFEIQFRKFHVPNETVLWLRLHRPDPSQRAFGYCSCKQDTKERYAGQQFVQMERNISFRPIKMDHTPSNSGRTKPKWSIPLDVPTEISGILGRLESAQWITGKRVSNFPSPDWHIGDSFFNFSIIVRSQILVNIF